MPGEVPHFSMQSRHQVLLDSFDCRHRPCRLTWDTDDGLSSLCRNGNFLHVCICSLVGFCQSRNPVVVGEDKSMAQWMFDNI